MYRNLSRGSRVLQRHRNIQQRFSSYEASTETGRTLLGAAGAIIVGGYIISTVQPPKSSNKVVEQPVAKGDNVVDSVRLQIEADLQAQKNPVVQPAPVEELAVEAEPEPVAEVEEAPVVEEVAPEPVVEVESVVEEVVEEQVAEVVVEEPAPEPIVEEASVVEDATPEAVVEAAVELVEEVTPEPAVEDTPVVEEAAEATIVEEAAPEPVVEESPVVEEAIEAPVVEEAAPEPVAEAVAEVVEEKVEDVVEIIEAVVEKVEEVVEVVEEKIEAVEEVTEATVAVVEEVVAEVEATVTEVAAEVTEVVAEAEIVIEEVAEVVSETLEEVEIVAEAIVAAVEEVAEVAVEAVEAVETVAEVVVEAVEEVAQIAEEVAEVVAEAPAEVVEAVEVAVETTVEEVIAEVAAAVEEVASLEETVEAAVAEAVAEVAAVADEVADVVNEVTAAVEEVKADLQEVIPTLQDEIQSVQDGVAEIEATIEKTVAVVESAVLETTTSEIVIAPVNVEATEVVIAEPVEESVVELTVDEIPIVEGATPESLVEDIQISEESVVEEEKVVEEATPEPVTEEPVQEVAEPVIAVEAPIEEVAVVEEVAVDYPEIPPEMPYVIVGGGTAAYAAVRAIRKYEPSAKILILSKEVQAPYNRTPLSKEMWFTTPDKSSNATYENWKGKEVSIYHEKEDFYCTTKELQSRKDYGGTALLLNATVDKLDPNEKKVILANGSEIKYDKVLIAVGGQPKSLPVFDQADEAIKSKVTQFRSVSDFWKLENLSRSEPGDIVVIGSGFLGTELAYALGERSKSMSGLTVTQVCRESGVLGAVLPLHLSNYASAELEKNNVNVVRNAQIESVNMVEDKMQLNLTDGRQVKADHAVLAVGVDVDNSLAERSGLEHDPARGGFIVNSELESRRDVFVAGDAANFYDIRLGRRRVEHYDHAIVTGRLAGENMTGKRKAYSHQSMFWSDIGADIGFEAIGLVDSRLKSVSVFTDQSGGDVLSEKQTNDKKYDRGVVFYTRNNTVVGVVTWNIFNKMGIARRLIAMEQHEPDYAELAKLFDVNKI